MIPEPFNRRLHGRLRDQYAEQLALDRAAQEQAAALAAAEAAAAEAQATERLASLQEAEAATHQAPAVPVVTPPGAALPHNSWPALPANYDTMTKPERVDWLATNAYATEDHDAAVEALKTHLVAELKAMMTTGAGLPTVLRAPPVAAVDVPMQIPQGVPMLASGETDRLIQMSKEDLIDWMMVNWYNNMDQLRPVLSSHSIEDLHALVRGHTA